MKFLPGLLLTSVFLPHIVLAQCVNNTAGDSVCQTGNYFQVGVITTAKDACDQIRDALGALNTSFGGVVDARGMVPNGGTPAALTCLDNRTNVAQNGDNPFYIDTGSRFAPPSQLLLGAQTLALTRQWVIPSKSSIVGLGGTSGYNSGPPVSNSNTVLVACNGTTFAPACTSGSNTYSFIPQLTHCTFSYSSSNPPAQIHCNSAHGLYPGNFVLIEGTGTDVDDAWEVTALPTGAPTTDFNINYTTGTQTSLSGLVVNIPLIWLGTNVGNASALFADEGIGLESLAVDCNDLPNSIGIFSATVNENSFLNHVSVRHCTRNGIYYKRTTHNGAPAKFRSR